MAQRDAVGKKVKAAKGVAATWEQEQSVLLFRKLLLRRHLMRWVRTTKGPFYVPFIGDGDIAVKLYGGRQVYGADLDPERVEVARMRLPGAEIREADCDSWPFPGLRHPVALADFDSYTEPYTSFRSFWKCAPKADRLVVVFTDGHRQGLLRTGWFDHPAGHKIRLGHEGGPRMGDPELKRPVFNSYLSKHVWPWFEDYIEPYRVLDRWRYQRDMMVYWGAAIGL